MSNIKTFTYKNNVYKYEDYAPLEAVSFGVKCAKTLGPIASCVAGIQSSSTEDFLTNATKALSECDEKALEQLLNLAFSRVYTPENECLGDPAVFNTWFTNRKDEIFAVGVIALVNLCKDFFPQLGSML